MVRLVSAFTALFALFAAPACASPKDAIGGSPHVKAVSSHGRTVITFRDKSGRRLFRKLAGREVTASCEQVTFSDPLSPFPGSSTGESFQAPKRGGKLRIDISGSDADWCELLLVRKHSDDEPVVAVAITPPGATFLINRWWALAVDGLLEIASPNGNSGRFATTDQIVAKSKGAVIGLANPADPVPPGRYGYYSDGARHAEAVAVTPAGKRLFEEVNGDSLSTNVLPYVNSLQFD
jgi:hypothetical protein